MSPGDGGGQRREAAAVLDGPSRATGSSLPLTVASWSSACSRSPANVSGASLRTGVAGSAAASAASVVISAVGQPRDLVAAHARHAVEVILAPPTAWSQSRRKSQRSQWSHGYGSVCRPARDRVEEPRPDAPVVGGHVGEPKRLALLRPEHDVRRVGLDPLDPRDRLAVEAELQRVRRLRPPRELRVEHLVGVVAERGRPLDPLEEVRDPAPAVEHERRLVDVGGPGAHRLGGARRGLLEVALLAEPDLDDLVPGVAQRLQEGGLVLVALAREQLAVGGREVRLLDLLERRPRPRAGSGARRRRSARDRTARSEGLRRGVSSH